MSETRKLAAILVADAVGFSRLAGADEERTLARLRGLRGLRSDLIDPAIAAHHGRIVKRTGIDDRVPQRGGRGALRHRGAERATPACRPTAASSFARRPYQRRGRGQRRRFDGRRRRGPDGRWGQYAAGSRAWRIPGRSVFPRMRGDR
jgi:hypothetical protein